MDVCNYVHACMCAWTSVYTHLHVRCMLIMWSLNFRDAGIFLKPDTNRIGHIYKKAIYKEYTDDTFSVERTKPDWLGIVGPILHGEVGDTIYVHFWNRASRHYSVHPHGIRYTKGNEGKNINTRTHWQRNNKKQAHPHTGTHIQVWTREVRGI